ncbi:MAG: Gfo/Idh/MocA family oxidoreductase [Victivallaceae bacterium]|nr:Gfo/Idh/MocA family oxidoreductase [Victivallaceae bacterium]
MRIVVIGGAGHIAYALQGIKKNPKTLELCAFASAVSGDMNDNTAKMLIAEFNAKAFDDWHYMLDVLKPDIAVIATRFDMNGVVSLECLKRGINCFTEKTIAHSMELLNELQQTAINNKVEIVGMHGMRYSPEFFAAYEASQNGLIGDVVMLYGRKSYHFNSNRPDFYRQRETYGGTILWVAVHALDWFCWFGGDISEIYATQTVKGNKGYCECEAAAVISMHFANNAIGTISADFLRPKNAGSHGDDQLRIAGEKGIIEVRHNKAILTDNENQPYELELKPEGDFFGDFCRSLHDEGQCRLTMADTFQVSKIALSAREAADKHKITSVAQRR